MVIHYTNAESIDLFTARLASSGLIPIRPIVMQHLSPNASCQWWELPATDGVV